MYKSASRFQLSKSNGTGAYKVEPKSARDEGINFAHDYLFYEQYLVLLLKMVKEVLFTRELSQNQKTMAIQMKNYCCIDLYGHELLEKIKKSDEITCEIFLKKATPELLKISERVIEANELLHLMCESFPGDLVKEIRCYVHDSMLSTGQKNWPGASVKEIKKNYLEYGIK
jgi:hypothetical protein